MKYLFCLLTFFLLTGCVSLPVNSVMDSCPDAQNLTEYRFYNGSPARGAEIMPEMRKDGAQEWKLSGMVYLQCNYKDGSTAIRKLPSSMDRCYAKDMQLTCTAWL